LREARKKKSSQKSGDNVSVLKNGFYLEVGQKLISANSKATLTVHDKKVTIQSGKKELWKWECEDIDQLVLEDGKLLARNKAGEPINYLYNASLATGDSIELLDNGNLELSDRDGNIVWESNSMVFSTIKKAGEDAVLSVHHTDFAPNMSFDIIGLTTMPFIGADHQLWYVNRNRQIVCKAMKDSAKKLCVECEDNGGITLKPLNHKNKAQQWIINANGFGSVINEKTGRNLSHPEDGKMLSAQQNSNNWEINADPAAAWTVKKELLMKIPPRIDEEDENRGYLSFEHKFANWIHLDFFDLNGEELRGIRLQKNGNRIAVKAITPSGEVASKVWDEGGKFESYDKSKIQFSKSPVYFNEGSGKLGLYKIKDNSYGIKSGTDSKEYINKNDADWLAPGKNGLNFLEMSAVIADDDQRVAGFGFTTTAGNRLSPYLLVVKK
ncbi:MAG: hypothetical protein V4616_01780, partial [Bacteroidota bacterium]